MSMAMRCTGTIGTCSLPSWRLRSCRPSGGCVAVDGDRERVALTLARVALGPGEVPRTVAAFNGLGVAARVDALLRPQPLRNEGIWSSTIGVGVVAVALSAALQAHHVVGLLITLCPG